MIRYNFFCFLSVFSSLFFTKVHGTFVDVWISSGTDTLWSNSNNWTSGVPNSNQAICYFNFILPGEGQIIVDGSFYTNALYFDFVTQSITLSPEDSNSSLHMAKYQSSYPNPYIAFLSNNPYINHEILVPIVLNADLDIYQEYNTSSSIISGGISGDYGIQIATTYPANPLILSGSNSYTGSTSVFANAWIQIDGTITNSYLFTNQGTTDISGSVYCVNYDNYALTSLTSTGQIYCTTFTNETSGTLSGCGTVTTSDTFYNYGTVISGCSPSSLTINTSTFIAEPGSVIAPFIDPTGVATLDISGNLLIEDDVTLRLSPEPGCYSDLSTFTVLEADSITGSFTNVDIQSILFTPDLSYSSSSVTVTLQRSPLTQFASQANEEAVAQSLECLFAIQDKAGTKCLILPRLFYLSQSQIADILNSMQPSLFKGMTISQENNVLSVQKALDVRLQEVLNSGCCPEEKRFHIWTDGFGDFLQQKTVRYAGSSQTGYQTKTGGAVLGFDTHFSSFRAGALTAYTGSDTKWSDSRGKGSIDTVYGGLYVSGMGEYVYGTLSVMGGWTHFVGHRNMDFGVETVTATHRNGGAQLLSHFDTGLKFEYKGFTIRPFDSFDYVSQTENAYTETGAGALNLQVKKSTAILLRNELGLRLSGCFSSEKSTWTMSPKLSWVREVRVKGAEYHAHLVGESCPFTVTGYFPDRSLISPGLLVSGSFFHDFLCLDVYFEGQYGKKFRNQNYGGEIRFGF